jgi:hypothetical protein
MHGTSFWALLNILDPYLQCEESGLPMFNVERGAKNGRISKSIRLSAALRYFAGGERTEDICLVHGISHTEVFRSVWKVVNAVNRCPQLAFSFPRQHSKQKAIAKGFKSVSKAGFGCCVGAVDGMLVWLEKPFERDCDIAQVGPKKFLCGRKKKFGFNLQGVCDHLGRFLDVCIGHPASTSDFLAFSISPLFSKLEEEGFLYPGLCLFGDNAYCNTNYMATPYKGIRSGTKDDYNFYHSQVSTVGCNRPLNQFVTGSNHLSLIIHRSESKLSVLLACW